MKSPLLVLVASFGLLSSPNGFATGKMLVSVANDLDTERPAETIEVPWSEIAKHLPGVLPSHILVKDAKGATLPNQLINSKPEEHHDNYEGIIFQHDFAASEHNATFVLEETATPEQPYSPKAFARYIPERFDDFAWENDRIAHRIYGPVLETPAAKKDQMVSSGIDVWVKRVSYPIIDRWYLMGHYHEDTGEGLDLYDVGKSRGCGGVGLWDGKKLSVSHNWKTWKVLGNGPVRVVFELGYESWDGGDGLKVSETKRITLDAGQNLSLIESTFSFQAAGKKMENTIGIGLAKHPKKAEAAAATQNQKAGWLSLWERYSGSQLGTAVLTLNGVQGFAEDELNHLALVKAKSGEPLRYYIGAGWSGSGDFPDQASWEEYLIHFTERLKSPLKLSYPEEK